MSGSQEEDEGNEEEESVECDSDEDGRGVVLRNHVLVDEVKVLDGFGAAGKSAWDLENS